MSAARMFSDMKWWHLPAILFFILVLLIAAVMDAIANAAASLWRHAKEVIRG